MSIEGRQGGWGCLAWKAVSGPSPIGAVWGRGLCAVLTDAYITGMAYFCYPLIEKRNFLFGVEVEGMLAVLVLKSRGNS